MSGSFGAKAPKHSFYVVNQVFKTSKEHECLGSQLAVAKLVEQGGSKGALEYTFVLEYFVKGLDYTLWCAGISVKGENISTAM